VRIGEASMADMGRDVPGAAGGAERMHGTHVRQCMRTSQHCRRGRGGRAPPRSTKEVVLGSLGGEVEVPP
jgi:hypothetical protein